MCGHILLKEYYYKVALPHTTNKYIFLLQLHGNIFFTVSRSAFIIKESWNYICARMLGIRDLKYSGYWIQQWLFINKLKVVFDGKFIRLTCPRCGSLYLGQGLFTRSLGPV